eukprot:jgi/Hompol1/2293/HPOL_005928-RA
MTVMVAMVVVSAAPVYRYNGYTQPSHPKPNPNAPCKFTILHTNDIHAHFDQFNSGGVDCSPKNIAAGQCYGGIARIKTVVDAFRANNSNVALMDAGDQFQGTLFFNVFGSALSTQFMNDL